MRRRQHGKRQRRAAAAGARTLATSSQVVEQGLGLLEVERIEALGEPAVDPGQQVAGLDRIAVAAQQGDGGVGIGGAGIPLLAFLKSFTSHTFGSLMAGAFETFGAPAKPTAPRASTSLCLLS